MSDPIGTSGLGGGSHVGADLAAVMQGGPTFLERMERLSEQTAAHEKALGDLALGRAARDAYVHANQIKANAEKIHDIAAKALSNANSQSTATLNEANATAARIIAAAQKEAEAIKAKALADDAQAILDADRLRGEAQALKDEAQALRDAAAAVDILADQTLSTANIEKAKIEADRQTANRELDRLVSARDTLAAAIRKADGYVLGV